MLTVLHEKQFVRTRTTKSTQGNTSWTHIST